MYTFKHCNAQLELQWSSAWWQNWHFGFHINDYCGASYKAAQIFIGSLHACLWYSKKIPTRYVHKLKFHFLEIFADEKCSVLISVTAIFAKCHVHLPPDQYYTVSTHYEQTATLYKLIWLINIKVKIVFAGRPVFKEPVIVATMCRGTNSCIRQLHQSLCESWGFNRWLEKSCQLQ